MSREMRPFCDQNLLSRSFRHVGFPPRFYTPFRDVSVTRYQNMLSRAFLFGKMLFSTQRAYWYFTHTYNQSLFIDRLNLEKALWRVSFINPPDMLSLPATSLIFDQQTLLLFTWRVQPSIKRCHILTHLGCTDLLKFLYKTKHGFTHRS